MDYSSFLGKTLDVKIDRPLGSKHPSYEMYYPINYGFVPNTISGDGMEIDCYILGVQVPLTTYSGTCIAIIHRVNDNEDKLVIAPPGKAYSNSEIRALTYFQEQYYESELIRPDGYLEFSKNIPELSVSNIENSLSFYKTAGFKIEYDRPESKFAFISLGEIQFMLQEISPDGKWDLAPLTYPFGNGINFQLEVKNVDSIYNSFRNANYEITFDLEENWYRQNGKLLGNKEFLITDPDGYLLRFSQDLGEKEA